MKWKSRNVRELAHIVCGDSEHFRYRSSSYITEFFQDCDLDYAHDGSTRWAWVASRLEEVLALPHPSPSVPPDAFIRIIRATLDKGDAQDGDLDRSKALAALNVVLAREGWEAFYDEHSIGQLRHIATNTIAQMANPHRPLTWAEVERREQLIAYLDKCSEDELIEEVLLPLFRQLGFHRIAAAGHKDKALAIYGAGKDGKNPVKDKQQLVEELRKSVVDVTAFCAAHGVSLSEIEATAVGSLERLSRIQDGMNALISPDSLRRDFFAYERLVSALYRAVKPDPAALEFASRVTCLSTLAEAIRATMTPNPPDVSQVMGQINQLLDASITGHEIRESGPPALDLSKINFEALAQRFKESKHKNTDLEMLKAAIRAQLEKMIRLNRTRADFAEKFESLIDSYNAGSRSIEELFEELVKLSNSLNHEQERHVRENMTEEDLVIFDILTRPAPELSGEERTELKKVARDLLTRLKALLVLNWRQKSTARSQLKLTIENALDSGLTRAYTPELYNQKCSAVFEHVYESYPE